MTSLSFFWKEDSQHLLKRSLCFEARLRTSHQVHLVFEMKVLLPFFLFIANLLSAGVDPICYGGTHVVCVGQGLSSFPTDLSENLQTIVLSDNMLTDLPASDLKKYPRLISLLLDHNKIKSSYDLRGISQLKELQELDISSNYVSLINFQVFEENLQLESIIANNNSNLEIADKAIDLPIKNVSFENCNLSEFPIKALSKFRELENLHLRLNNITTIPGNLTTLFPKLKELWISNNPLSSIDPELCQVVDVTTHPSCSFETKPVIQSLPGTTATSFLAEESSFEDVELTTEKRLITTITNTVTESKKEASGMVYCILFAVLLVALVGSLLYYKHFYSSRRNEDRPHPEEDIPLRDVPRQQS